MYRSLFISLLVVFAALTVHASRPNVIFILTDDLGYGDVYNLYQYTRDNGAGGGIAGDGIINGTEEPFIHTPGLDRMASEGIRLTRHYTSAPVCAPARSSLMQGLDQGHATVRDNDFDKAIENNFTLGTVMKQAGYYTAAVGKWGIGGSSAPYTGHPNDRGFDYFYGYMRHGQGHEHYPGNGGTVWEQKTGITSGLDHAYSSDLFTAKAKSIVIDRVQNHSGTPFFLYLALTAPHAKLQVPTQAYPPGRGMGGGLTWPLNTNSGVNDSWIHPDYASRGDIPVAEKRHATMVRRVDDCVDDILQTLRDLGVATNTLVVFTSDNGPHNEAGTGGSYTQDPRFFDSYANMEGIKRDTWEAGIREPTFAWWPNHIDNGDTNTPITSVRPSAFWDWMPTFAEAAGVTPPAWSSGVSLLPELTGSGIQQDKGYLYFEYSVSGSTPAYTQFPNHGGNTRGQMQVIFMDDADGKRYKGIRTGIVSAAADFQIYDVDADPVESTNLASSKPALQQAMKDKVLQVRIDGDYARPYSGANLPAASLTAVNGLEYKTYIGSFGWVPETAYLTASTTGTCSRLDLSVRPQDDNIVIEYTGYIMVTTAGTYNFRLTTDSTVGSNSSGGALWLHDANLISDDFNHDGTAKSASVNLAAGLHPIRVLYKHATGEHDLQLWYSGPGIALQPVPDTSFYIEGVPAAGPPEAFGDLAYTQGSAATSGATVLIDVLANDIDDGTPSPLTITAIGNPLAGTALIESGKISYTPNAGFFGIDYFSYTISDGQDTATAYITVQVATGYSACWRFEEGTGNTETREQVSATPSDIIADSWSTGTAAPDSTFAYQLAGTLFGSNIGSADAGIDGSGAKTIVAWINTTSTTDGTFFNFSPTGGTLAGNDLRLIIRNGGIRMEVSLGGFEVGDLGLTDGNWHMLAFVVHAGDGINDVDYYVDGNYVTRSGGGTFINTATTGAYNLEIGFGTDQNGNRGYIGLLDDVATFPWALSKAELDAIMVNGVFPTMPLAVEDLAIGNPMAGTRIQWTAIPGQVYNVQTNDDLAEGTWSSYISGIPGNGATVVVNNPVDADQLFFRIISE